MTVLLNSNQSAHVYEIEVEMQRFGNGAIRKVHVPKEEWDATESAWWLELVFKWGQNDFQPRPMPSVSAGDVIRLKPHRWLVQTTGFTQIE